jgi:hypothetical protein
MPTTPTTPPRPAHRRALAAALLATAALAQPAAAAPPTPAPRARPAAPARAAPPAARAAPAPPARRAPAPPAPGQRVDRPPRFALLGSQPADGGQLVGNLVALLFGALPAEVGTPPAAVHDEATDQPVQSRTQLDCRGEGPRRQCAVTVLLYQTVRGHRYRVTVLEQTIRVTAVDGHPGERRR